MAGPTLKAKATLDDNPFKRKLRGMVSLAAAAGKKMGGSLKKVGGAIGIGGGIAAGAAVAGVYKLTKGTIDQGAALYRLSRRTGIAVRDLDILGDTFEESGSDLNAMAAALGKMNKNLAAAATGGTPLAMMLEETGSSIKDFLGLQPAEQFQGLAKAIIGLKNPLAQAAMAEAAFGKAGQDLIPTLYEIADLDMKALDKGADAMGRAAKDAYEVKKSMTEAGNAVGDLTTGIFKGLAPSIKYAAEYWKKKIDPVGIGDAIGGAISGGGNALAPMVSTGKDPFANFNTANKSMSDGMAYLTAAREIGGEGARGMFPGSGLKGASMAGAGFKNSLASAGGLMGAQIGSRTSSRGDAALRREASDRQFQITGKRPGSSPGAYGAVRRGDAAMRSAIATEKERAGLGLPALNDKVGSILQILQSFE